MHANVDVDVVAGAAAAREPPVVRPPPGEQASSPLERAFLDGFSRAGGRLSPKCALATWRGMGRGVLALRDVRRGELLFSVPRTALLGLRTSELPKICAARDDEEGHGGGGLDNGEPTAALAAAALPPRSLTWKSLDQGWTQLILCLMWERWRARAAGATSAAGAGVAAAPPAHWGWYLDTLPDEFDTPMFWDDEELQELQGTAVPDRIGRQEATAMYQDLVRPYVVQNADIFFGVGHGAAAASADEGSGADVEHLVEQHYPLRLFHVMGSLVLSRSFHVKGAEYADDDDDGGGEEEDGNVGQVDREAQAADDSMQGSEEPQVGRTGDEDQGAEQNDEEQEGDQEKGEEEEDEDEEERESPADISMVPMADALNAHSGEGFNNARLFYRRDALEMRATRAVAAGEQLWNTYGDPPNSDLLRRYGHVDEPNAGDVAELDAEYLVRAALQIRGGGGDAAAERQALLRRVEWGCSHGLDDVVVLNRLFPPSAIPPYRPEPAADISLEEARRAAAQRDDDEEDEDDGAGGRGAPPRGIGEEVLVAARLLLLRDESFDRAVRKERLPSARVESVDEVEKAGGGGGCASVARLLQKACELKLESYRTTMESDEAALLEEIRAGQAGKGSSIAAARTRRRRMALVVRLGEKHVLWDHIRCLRVIADAVEGASTGAKKSGARTRPDGDERRRSQQAAKRVRH